MRIASITLKNFRAYRDETTIYFGPFSAMVGRNDSGKSSILHALDIFFNRPPDLYDFTVGMHEDEQMEITLRFTDLPKTIQLEEGVDTTFAEENLLDDAGLLCVKRVYSKWTTATTPKKFPTNILVMDYIEDDFQNLCSKKETELNRLGTNYGLDFTKSGKGITNKSKRQALRAKANADSIAIQQAEYGVSDDLWRQLNTCLPDFSMFKTDWSLSEEETEFQNVFRVMVEDATKGKQDRDNLETFIREHIDQEVDKIYQLLLKHTDELGPLRISPEFKWKGLVSFNIDTIDRHGVELPLRKRGAGLRRLLMVAYFQYLAAKNGEEEHLSNDIFGIEEPETYLHPGAQRDLLDSLNTIASSSQVLITTHSPVFAGATEPERLIWIKKIQGAVDKTQGQDLDLEEIALDLGVEPSDKIYGYRACIFVEGHDDVDFLTQVASTLKESGHLAETFTDKQIGLIPVGGCGNLKLWINRQAMRSLSMKYGLFADSDKKYDSDCLSTEKVRWQQECEADGAVVHFTRKREIENYLHPEVVLEITGKSVNIDDFCNVKALVGDKCCGLIEHTSADQFLERDLWKDEQGNERHEILEAIQAFLDLA